MTVRERDMQLSISGLARLTGKSERTIARYLKDGPLAHCTRLDGGLYDVDETTLLQLRPQDIETTILQKLASIDERLERIEEALSRRRDSVATRENKQVAAPVRSDPYGLGRTEHPNQLSFPDVPTGELIPLATLAATLGIKRPAISEHISKGHYQSTKIQGKHYFTTEQAEQAREYHATHPQRGKG